MDASSTATPCFVERTYELSWIRMPERLNVGARNMSVTDFFCLNPEYSTSLMVMKKRPKIENSSSAKLQGQLFLPRRAK